MLEKCGWKSLSALMQQNSLIYFHKIFYTKRPGNIENLFIKPDRVVKKITMRDNFSNNVSKHMFMKKILDLYNEIKVEIRLLPPSKFKVKFKKLIPYEGLPH